MGTGAYIKTSATIAGGNSGGLAVNERGELIGVPTAVGSGDLEDDIVDCRALLDTNRDGYIDENDTCVPTGGFINALRPINLARELILAAQQGQVAIETGTIANENFNADGQVIFEDNFDDPESGWGEIRHPNTASPIMKPANIRSPYVLRCTMLSQTRNSIMTGL